MHELLNILAQRESDGMELLWIIAVILFSAVGGLSEWLKKRRAENEPEQAAPRPRKPAAPARRTASGSPLSPRPSDSRTPPTARPPVSRPQAPPQRPMPAQQRATRPPPARKAVPAAPPRRSSAAPLPQRGIPTVPRSGPGELPPAVAAQRQREATRKPITPPAPPTRKEQAPDAQPAQPVRTAEMARQEVADRRPNIARELIFKPGQPLGRTEWRRAIVLNELLGPPVALRGETQVWDR